MICNKITLHIVIVIRLLDDISSGFTYYKKK